MAPASSPNILERSEHRRIGTVTLVLATFLSIGLGNASARPLLFYAFWSGILALASLPVVVLSLRRHRFGRALILTFLAPVAAGAIAHMLLDIVLAVLAPPVALWLTCLITVLASPARRARLVADRGRCGACGYDLTGNVSGACPECGETVGPVVAVRPLCWAVLRSLLLWIVGAAVGLGVFGLILYKITSQPI